MATILLCLHGWGGSKESFTELHEALEGTPDLTILTPDLPGFGDEPEPQRPWTNDDYAQWVEQWLHKQPATDNQQLFILGHSHGGRIAMKLVLRGNMKIDHLFLCASAGIRHPRHFKRMIGLLLAKTGKFFLKIPGLKSLQPLARKLLYKLVRVHDYEKASPLMQQTMLNVSHEDFRPYLEKIDVPVALFWGEDDGMTPVSDGHLMKKMIPRATLQTYPHVRHRVHRDRAQDIADAIKQAL